MKFPQLNIPIWHVMWTWPLSTLNDLRVGFKIKQQQMRAHFSKRIWIMPHSPIWHLVFFCLGLFLGWYLVTESPLSTGEYLLLAIISYLAAAWWKRHRDYITDYCYHQQPPFFLLGLIIYLMIPVLKVVFN